MATYFSVPRKKIEIEGLTDHLITVAQQVNPRSFFSKEEGPDLTRLVDALIRHVTGARPVNNKPLETKIRFADAVPKVKDYLLNIHEALKWDLTSMKWGEERFFLATFVTAWTQYRYSGKLPDNFGIARKK